MGKTWRTAAPLLAFFAVFFTIFAAEAKPRATVEMKRVSEKLWTAEVTITEPVYALLLVNSRNNWRKDSWRVRTRGVVLERRGGHDVIYARGAVPFTKIHIDIKPFFGRLQAEYQPFLGFSDGSVGIYTGQFDLAVIPSPKAADRLPPRLPMFSVQLTDVDIYFSDPRGARFYVQGVWNKGRTKWSSGQPATYVYAGHGSMQSERAISAIIDPGLSPWLRDELTDFSAKLISFYSKKHGARLPAPPTALVAYGGPTMRGYSMRGSVLPGLVMLEMSGTSLSNGRSPEVRAQVRWFFAHEFAHFWNAQLVGMRTMNTAWIHEGGADATAIRAMEAIAPEGFDGLQAFQDRLDSCSQNTRGVALNQLLQKDRFDEVYSCGAILHLIAEQAIARRAPGADVMDFWRYLIKEAHKRDRIVDERLWLKAMTELSGMPQLAETLDPYLHKGVRDPSRVFQRAFQMAQIPHHRDRRGRLVLDPPAYKYVAQR